MPLALASVQAMNRTRHAAGGLGWGQRENDSKGGKEKERDVADTEWT